MSDLKVELDDVARRVRQALVDKGNMESQLLTLMSAAGELCDRATEALDFLKRTGLSGFDREPLRVAIDETHNQILVIEKANPVFVDQGADPLGPWPPRR